MLGDPDDLDLSFVPESGHNNFPNAQGIFDQLKERGPPHVAQVLRTIIAGDKKEFPGLQGADGGAHHVLVNERGRSNPPDTITIPAPSKNRIAATSPWQHYNFIISPEKLAKAEIMREVQEKRARRQPPG
jgi:hypothetical protein